MNISFVDVFKANKLNNITLNNISTACNLYLVGSSCPSDIDGFMHYRHLDLCYNFNPEHYIDYLGHIKQTCSSYGGELLRIDSTERQTYIEHVLEGRTTTRVAIQGHCNNPGNVWTFDDGTQLPYTNWRSGDAGRGSHLQIFTNDVWTAQDDFVRNKNNIFLCERIP
ncbi:COLEC12 [Mytilus edulis]|uniref:COLEC12 n=1 Tax=Mytilus edulis TaxID=6550 RepID=A0A8S3QU97_MYTED|nr:COLEC12 [Mytilus edulis]